MSDEAQVTLLIKCKGHELQGELLKILGSFHQTPVGGETTAAPAEKILVTPPAEIKNMVEPTVDPPHVLLRQLQVPDHRPFDFTRGPLRPDGPVHSCASAAGSS